MKMRTSRLTFLLSLSLGLLASTVPSASAVTYETYENPFSKDSIWNLPIANGAQYTPAGLAPTGTIGLGRTTEVVQKFKASDPVKKVFKLIDRVTTKDPSLFCKPSNRSKEVLAEVHIGSDFLWDERISDGRGAFVLPASINGLPAGEVVEFYALERCGPGQDLAANYVTSKKGTAGYSPNHHITNNGYPNFGMHGGTRLSVLGGTIREREFSTGGPLDPIPHALKVSIGNDDLYYNPKDATPGYRWPAKTADSCAKNGCYKGTNPHLEAGSLLAIKPDFKCASLASDPAKKICRTLQVYGAYVPDSFSGGGRLGLSFQWKSIDDDTIVKELKSTYGIEYFKPNANAQSKQFKNDMGVVAKNLHIITNASPEFPKGPGGASPTILTSPQGLKVVGSR